MSDRDSTESIPEDESGEDRQAGLSATSADIETFHQSLHAALNAGFALELGSIVKQKNRSHWSPLAGPNQEPWKVPTGRLTLRKLAMLESVTRSFPPTWSEATAQSSPLPQKYVAGFSLYQTTGRTDLVLDAMSVDIRARRELARVARPSLAYLAVLALLGAMGLAVLSMSLLMFDEMQEDLLRMPHSMSVSGDSPPWITPSQIRLLPWILLASVIAVLACLLPPVSSWIAKCLGGWGYQRAQRRAIAARVEHALILAGVAGPKAEQLAAQLVGYRRLARQSTRMLSRNDQSGSDLQRLALESKHYLARSNTRLRQMRIGLPFLLIAVVGSAGVLIYALILVVPLTSLLHDLSAPIVDPIAGWSK